MFNTAGNIIFGLQLEQEYDDEPKFETSFRTFDCSDYSSIATIEVKKSVIGLCPQWDDMTIGKYNLLVLSYDPSFIAMSLYVILKIIWQVFSTF